MKEFILMVGFFLLLLLFALCMSSLTDYTRCKEISNALNYKYTWHYWTGCVIEKPDGSKALLRQMRDFERK